MLQPASVPTPSAPLGLDLGTGFFFLDAALDDSGLLELALPGDPALAGLAS